MTTGTAVQVRPASRADVPAILAIYNHAVLHTTASYDLEPQVLETRLAWFDLRVQEGWPVLVAEQARGAREDRVVGWSTYGRFRDKPGYRHSVEHSVYVAPDVQARGVGTALMRPLIERARQDGHHVMIAGVDADNAGSLRFHERLVFVSVAHFRQVGHKFGRWLDLVFLQLMLEQPGEKD